jgi:aspartate aminotransferase
LSKKTKAVYLCNPNNPTGTYYSHSEIKRLYQFCLQHNLYLIGDEVYRDFVYQQKRPTTALNLEKRSKKGQIIIVDSFSKRYSLCGIRVGCLVCRDKSFIQQVLKYGQARLSAGDLDQSIALRMEQVPSNYLKRVKKEYQERREIVYQGLSKIKGAYFSQPEGAFYNIVKLPVKNADKFCKWLLTDFRDKKETVMLAPANGFYLSKNKGQEEVRLAFVINQKALKRAMEILKKAVFKWRQGLSGF